MSVSIYKSGQGYWTRLMSAVGAGVLVAAAVQWVWAKLSNVQADWVIFLQAGVAVAMLAVFAWMIYKYVGSKPRTCDFLIATEGEMKKVNWPSQKEVIGATWVVVACVLLLTALLFIADTVFFWIFSNAGVIQTS